MSALQDAVNAFIERGWQVVPLARGKKAPGAGDWLGLIFGPEDFDESSPDNVGLKTGEASGGLVDVDLDAPEAVNVASAFLPETSMIHGRPSRPQSHWWYVCREIGKSRKWQDIDDSERG